MKLIENQKALIMVAILILSIIFSTIVTELRQAPILEDKPIAGNEESGIIEIDVDDYFAMRESNSLSVIHVGSPNCTWSKNLDPYLEEITEEYGFAIYYLNIDKFTKDEEETFNNSHELLKEGYGTPTLIIVGNGDIVEKREGYTENKDAYIGFFREYNFIK
ncbi:MAG: thioredoxin family protein [Bacilli bacterium]|nr:thioredoxin family protein [Bacilli bacterium]